MSKISHSIDNLASEAFNLTINKKKSSSRIINLQSDDIPTIDELYNMYENGELTPDELTFYIYYFYPSVWIEDRVRSPVNPDEHITLWSHQIKVLDNPDYKKALRFGRQIGKCVHKDTLIMLGSGDLMRAEDLYNMTNVFEILSWNQKTYKPEIKTAYISDNGKKPIFEIVSESGNITKVTAEHPFWVLKDGNDVPVWMCADELNVGDKVAVVNSLYNIFNIDYYELANEIRDIWKNDGYFVCDNDIISLGFVFYDESVYDVREIQSKLLKLGIRGNVKISKSRLYRNIYGKSITYSINISDEESVLRFLKYIIYDNLPHKIRSYIDGLNIGNLYDHPEAYIYWDTVTNIKRMKNEQTYSISVNDNHTLMNDFFITHNSTTMVLKAMHVIVFNDNRRVVFYAPQQKHIDNLFGELDKYIMLCDDIANLVNKRTITEDDLENVRVGLITSTKRPQVRKFTNGSSIEGVILANTSDEMGLSARGISATDVFFDEAAFIPNGAFSAALLTTRSFIRPTIWISSTPTLFGMKFRELCQSPSFTEFHVSAEEADNWTPELEAFYKENLTKEEYELDIKANWGETSEGVFRKKYIQLVPINSQIKIGDVNKQYTYYDVPNLVKLGMFKYIVFGVDWNKPQQGTRIIVFGVTPDLRMFVLENIRISADLGQLYAIDEIIKLDNKYGRQAYIFVDEGFGDFPTEELHMIGVRDESGLNERVISVPTNSSIEIVDVFTGQKKTEPVNVVVTKTTVLFLERGWLHWPEEENIVEDVSVLTKLKKSGIIPLGNAMESYIIDRYTPNGRPIYKSSIGDDHALTAFMYGVFGVNHNIRPTHLVDNVLIKHTGKPQTIVIEKDPLALKTIQNVKIYDVVKRNMKNVPIVSRGIYNHNNHHKLVKGKRSLW